MNDEQFEAMLAELKEIKRNTLITAACVVVTALAAFVAALAGLT